MDDANSSELKNTTPSDYLQKQHTYGRVYSMDEKAIILITGEPEEDGHTSIDFYCIPRTWITSPKKYCKNTT